jgi:hypothetical protein
VRKAEPEATGRYGLSSVNLAWFHGTRPTRKSRLKHSTKAYAPGVDGRQRIVELPLHRLSEVVIAAVEALRRKPLRDRIKNYVSDLRWALICSWLAIAHSASAITSGTRVRPNSVTSYSTRGGTSA